MNRCRLGHALESAAAVMLLGLMLLFPQQVVQGAQEGLRCCAEQLIPALFPFLIVCQMVVDCPAAGVLGQGFLPYLRLLGISSPSAGTALLMGLLGGFAPAGRCVARLRQQNLIQDEQAQALLVACAGSGPGFVVNSVGMLMLGSPVIGWVLVACQTAASLICGFAAARFLRLPISRRASCPPAAPDGKEKSGLAGTILQSAQAMLAICGTVVLFRCLYQTAAPVFRLDERISVLGAMLLEVTSGCLEASRLPGNTAIYGCCAALSLLSGSVFLQLRTLLPESVSLKPLLVTRLLHLPVSLGMLHLALRLMPDLAAQVVLPVGPVLLLSTRARPDAALALFALCCLVAYRLQKAGAGRCQSGTV